MVIELLVSKAISIENMNEYDVVMKLFYLANEVLML